MISDPQEMSEVFVRSLSSVFSPVLLQVVNLYQESETEMDKAFSQLSKLDKSSAPGNDGVNPKLLKSCAVTPPYPLMLTYIKSL